MLNIDFLSKDEIRARIISMRAQMDVIANKEYQSSDDLLVYKNLSAQCDVLYNKLFNTTK